jgi:hypothetical protein
MDGRIPLGEQWGDGTQPQNHPLIYTDAEIDNCIARVKRGETSIYLDTDRLLWAALGRYPIMGKSVAVMGSISPWYEATCIHFGARPTTIEYNPIISKSSRVEAMTVAELDRSPRVFDGAISMSSFEHDGLGMYGDPLDPNGDLKDEEHAQIGRAWWIVISVYPGWTGCFELQRTTHLRQTEVAVDAARLGDYRDLRISG